MATSSKQPQPLHTYRWPLVVLAGGTIIPLATGIASAVRGSRIPQCPSYPPQAHIDSGSCIIGANMSGVYILFAIPFVLLAMAAAGIWALVIWRKRRRSGR